MSKFEVSWYSCHKVFRKLGYVLTKILKGTSYNYSTTLKRLPLGGNMDYRMYDTVAPK